MPAILIAFWLFSSLLLNKDISFSVLRYSHNLDIFGNFDSGLLISGKKLTGEIRAKDNNLGLVSIRFNDFLTDYQKEEYILFRLKEKGKVAWYSNSQYKIGLLKSNSLFPFGIFPIHNSKNKEYVFEIESSSVNPNNAIQVSRNQPSIFTSYQFSREELKQNIVIYMVKKIINSLTNKDFLFASTIYLFPLISYLLFIRIFNNLNLKKVIFLVSLNFLYLDAIFISAVAIPIAFIVLVAWLIYISRFELGKSVSFLMSAVLLSIWMFLTYFNIADYSYKLSFWVYFFLAIGIFQIILESISNEKV